MNSKMESKAIRYKKILNNLQFKIMDTYKEQKLQLYSYIRLGLLCKYDKSIKAIYKLDLAGFFEDANIILRTVFENFITIMYCEINPNEFYKRFFDYNVFSRLGYINENNEISKLISMINKEEIENMNQKKQEFIKNYKPKKFFKWNDMNILELCKKLDKYYKTKFYSSMYIIIYKNNSEYIHPNIVNIFENYININSKEKK